MMYRSLMIAGLAATAALEGLGAMHEDLPMRGGPLAPAASSATGTLARQARLLRGANTVNYAGWTQGSNSVF